MKIVFLSEHYYPRIGGVTTYVDKIVHHAGTHFDEVTLLTPSEDPNGEVCKDTYDSHLHIKLGVGCALTGDISSQTRKDFITFSFALLKKYDADGKFDIIHCLFGLYTLQYFDFQYFRTKGVKCGVTIHNIPPAECGVSWRGDAVHRYIKDEIRKIGVGLLNKYRITRPQLDFYIVPSHHVQRLLSSMIALDKIHVIHHGIDTDFTKHMYLPDTKKPIEVLCVGGFVPHKRQDLLIDIAHRCALKSRPLHFTLVGPIRNKTYFDYIYHKKPDNVSIRVSIPYGELIQLYAKSDIYVQPSAEEGFCLTALDAAAAGLPIVGTRTGAIPEIIHTGAGIVCDFDILSIENALMNMSASLPQYRKQARDRADTIHSQFTWDNAILKLRTILDRL